MSQAGEAIQRIKPVFMMSPLSVAVHLPPELPRFDMVIFDEASQIKPEDALCAIARAKQCIVVGDTGHAGGFESGCCTNQRCE